MVNVQMLSELEEVIQYKLVPERREAIQQMWWDRLQVGNVFNANVLQTCCKALCIDFNIVHCLFHRAASVFWKTGEKLSKCDPLWFNPKKILGHG